MQVSKKPLIMVALIIGMSNSMIMQTMLSTSLPIISNEFSSSAYYSWVYSGYILASSVTIPIFGKICDRFGYRKNYLAGGILFLAGTVWCAVSGSMLSLVFARITMGIGAGIVVPATYGIIDSLYSKEQLRRIFGVLAVVQIVSNGLGGIIGGFFSSSYSWRMGVWLLVPLEIIGAILIWKLLPSSLCGTEQSKIKTANAILLTIAVLMLMLGIEQLGHALIAVLLFVAGLAMAVAFWLLERRSGGNLLPDEFRRNPLLKNLSIQVFLMGALMNLCLVYIPGRLQTTGHLSSQDSSTILLLYVVAMGIGSIASGIIKASGKAMLGIGWAFLLLGGGTFFLPFHFHIVLGTSSVLHRFCSGLVAEC